MYIVEEEVAFRKFKKLVDLQRRNGVKAGSRDKLNKTVCSEMIDNLAEVISEMMDYFEKATFASVSGDGSQAWRAGEEKELIYGKFLVRGDVGLSPSTFLLACQVMKDFGGANADVKKEAFIAACAGHMEVLKKKITCLCADGAAVNMGRKRGALIQLSDYCDVPSPYIIHFLNHNLELTIKDSYSKIQEFEEIKESLHILFKMMKDSGKMWDAFQVVGDHLGVKVLQYMKVTGTCFQAHVQRGLSNFLRNFWCMLLFAENVVEQGSGVDSLVTKKMYPKIIGMRKKFMQFGWFAAAIQFYKVLNETSQLSLYMESDSVSIYQLSSKIKETCFNLQGISEEEDYKYLPSSVEIIDKDLENDLIVITRTSNGAENNKEFQLTGVVEDKVKVD